MQAIMRMIEAMEKSEARKQENQKHRRESTCENEVKKNFAKNRNTKARKVDETKNRDEKANGQIHPDSMNDDDEDEDCEGSKENSMKPVTKSEHRDEDPTREKQSGIIENGGRIKVENRDDENEHNDLADKEVASQNKTAAYKRRQSPSKVINKLMADEKEESEEVFDNESSTCKRTEKSKGRTPARISRVPRPTPKARATAKPKITRARKLVSL